MSEPKGNPLAALGLTVSVALILLAALAVYLLWQSSDNGPGLRQKPQAREQAAQRTSKFKRAYPEFDSVEEELPKASKRPASTQPAPVQSAPHAPVRAFPEPASVPIGMEKSKLIASFGRPNMITTEVSEGRAMETFHYLRSETGTETVVQLNGGKVVSAASASY
jgi:hypothetical protein